LAKEETTKFRFMLEMPNSVKIYSSDEEFLSRILEKSGLFTSYKSNTNMPIESSNVTVGSNIQTESAQENNSALFSFELKPSNQPQLEFSREEIIKTLCDFIDKNKRPPRRSEPNFQNIIYHAEKIFGSWEKALNASGASTYKEWRKQYGLNFAIKKILNHNPLTLHDLKLEIGKIDKFSNITLGSILTTIKQSKDVLSTGVHGHKLYFIKGQEPAKEAYPELNLLDRAQVEEEIFKVLVKPMTKNEIIDRFTANGHRGLDGLIATSLYKFWREEKIWRLKFVAHVTGGQKYSATDLFGALAGKIVFCRKDCPGTFALYIHENIQIGNDSHGFSTALTMRLKRVLPKEVLELI
jgi:hypothetical protein